MKQKFNMANVLEEFQMVKNGNPGTWGWAPKIFFMILIFIAVIVAGYFVVWSSQEEDMAVKAAEQEKLKQEYTTKKSQAANVEEYTKLLGETESSFSDLLRRLPSRIDMDQTLSDIYYAAQANDVKLSLIRPTNEISKDIYVEQPIDLVAVGTYGQYGRFAAAIASLPRIITISNFKASRINTNNPYIVVSEKDPMANGLMDKLIEFKTVIKTFRSGSTPPPAKSK